MTRKIRRARGARHANYEVARPRVPADMLPALARIFGVGVDKLLRLKNGAGKRGDAEASAADRAVKSTAEGAAKLVIKMLEGVLSQSSR